MLANFILHCTYWLINETFEIVVVLHCTYWLINEKFEIVSVLDHSFPRCFSNCSGLQCERWLLQSSWPCHSPSQFLSLYPKCMCLLNFLLLHAGDFVVKVPASTRLLQYKVAILRTESYAAVPVTKVREKVNESAKIHKAIKSVKVKYFHGIHTEIFDLHSPFPWRYALKREILLFCCLQSYPSLFARQTWRYCGNIYVEIWNMLA